MISTRRLPPAPSPRLVPAAIRRPPGTGPIGTVWLASRAKPGARPPSTSGISGRSTRESHRDRDDRRPLWQSCGNGRTGDVRRRAVRRPRPGRPAPGRGRGAGPARPRRRREPARRRVPAARAAAVDREGAALDLEDATARSTASAPAAGSRARPARPARCPARPASSRRRSRLLLHGVARDRRASTAGPPRPSAGTRAWTTTSTRGHAVDQHRGARRRPGRTAPQTAPSIWLRVRATPSAGPRSAVAAYRAPSEAAAAEGVAHEQDQRHLQDPQEQRDQHDQHQHEVHDRGTPLPWPAPSGAAGSAMHRVERVAQHRAQLGLAIAPDHGDQAGRSSP